MTLRPSACARPWRMTPLGLLALLAALLVLPLVPAPALAASWGLDTSFSDDGELTTGFGSSSDEAHSLAIDSKGRIVLAGDSYSSNSGNSAFALARYNPDGSLDPSFDGDGKLTTQIGGFSYATSVAIDAKGRIVVGGSSAPALPATDTDFTVARYKPGGKLDRSFDGDGKLTTDFGGYEDVLYSLAIDAEGRILAGGTSQIGSSVGMEARVPGPAPLYSFALARYKPDGSLDTSFDGDGKLTTQIGSSSYANSVAIDAADRIVAAGGSDPPDADSGFALARYNPDGSLDTSFDGDGKLTTPISEAPYAVARSLAIAPDGRIVAGGFGTTSHGEAFVLARYNVNGSLDPSFSEDGKLMGAVGISPNYANSIALDAAGRIVAGGSRWNGSYSELAVLRFDPDGSLDTDFSADGGLTTLVGADSGANALALDRQGRIVLGGSSYSDYVGGDNDFALARYRADVAGKATAAKTQKQHGNAIVVKVNVSADEGLTANASGKIEVNPSYKLRPKKAELTAGEASTLKLKPKKAQAKEIGAALKRGDSATAKLKVKLSDLAGNSEVMKLRVRLQR